MVKEMKFPQYSCGYCLYAITEKEQPKGTYFRVPLSSSMAICLQKFKFMKHLFIFILLFSSYSFTGLAQIYSASNPSCSTNCDLLRVGFFYSNEISSMLRLSFIGPYSSGSYYLNKEMVLYAYDGSRRIGTYNALKCYFLDKNGRVSSMSFNKKYNYQSGKSYCDIVIEFEPIPLYATRISIQEPSVGTSDIPWHWNDIAMIKNSSHSNSSSSSSSSYSSGGSSSNSNSNKNSVSTGEVLLGIAAVAAGIYGLSKLFDKDTSSSSSASSSSSSSYNDLYVSASDIQSTNSYCTLNDLQFYSYKNADYEYSTIILKNGHDYILYKLRNTSSSSRYYIYVYDIDGKKSPSKRYYATSRDAVDAIEKMDCRFCKWFKNKKGHNATYTEFSDWHNSNN